MDSTKSAPDIAKVSNSQDEDDKEEEKEETNRVGTKKRKRKKNGKAGSSSIPTKGVVRAIYPLLPSVSLSFRAPVGLSCSLWVGGAGAGQVQVWEDQGQGSHDPM